MSTPEPNAGERKAVRRLVRHLIKHGFSVIGVNNGDDDTITVETMDQIIEHVFSVDCSHLIVQSNVDLGGTVSTRKHWIFIVLGNASDGSEIINDYGVPADPSDGFDKAMEAFHESEERRLQ